MQRIMVTKLAREVVVMSSVVADMFYVFLCTAMIVT